MNRIERLFGLKGEAKLRYGHNEFKVVIPGDFVRCAVSGQPIAVADLRYWSVPLQEAYATAEIAFARYRETEGGRKMSDGARGPTGSRGAGSERGSRRR